MSDNGAYMKKVLLQVEDLNAVIEKSSLRILSIKIIFICLEAAWEGLPLQPVRLLIQTI